MPISIALATYNGALYLREQLASLAAQTLPPAELIVSDDGSTDATLEIISGFATTAPFPVRILQKSERLGFSDNFLHAAAACRHELVAFCDQDDVWLPQKLADAQTRLLADDSLLALHRLITTDQYLNPIGEWTQGIGSDAVFEPLQLNPYKNGWGNTMLFHRALATALPRQSRPRQPESDKPLSHDSWIYLLAAGLGRVSHLTAPLILYRQHGANLYGAAGRSLWRRLQRRAQDAIFMARLRERMLFYGHAIANFEALAAAADSPFATAAAAAASRYVQRYQPIASRLAIYDAPSFAARLRAFQAMRATPGFTPKSQLKDAILGVTGLHARLASA